VASPAVDDGIQDICVAGDQLVLVGWTRLTILGPGSRRWQSQRVAWDGIEDVNLEGPKLFASGWDALGDVWRRPGDEDGLLAGRSSGTGRTRPGGPLGKGALMAREQVPMTDRREVAACDACPRHALANHALASAPSPGGRRRCDGWRGGG